MSIRHNKQRANKQPTDKQRYADRQTYLRYIYPAPWPEPTPPYNWQADKPNGADEPNGSVA